MPVAGLINAEHLCADELVQQLEIGQTVTIVGVPVLDTTRKVVTLEACYFANVSMSS